MAYVGFALQNYGNVREGYNGDPPGRNPSYAPDRQPLFGSRVILYREYIHRLYILCTIYVIARVFRQLCVGRRYNKGMKGWPFKANC